MYGVGVEIIELYFILCSFFFAFLAQDQRACYAPLHRNAKRYVYKCGDCVLLRLESGEETILVARLHVCFCLKYNLSRNDLEIFNNEWMLSSFFGRISHDRDIIADHK